VDGKRHPGGESKGQCWGALGSFWTPGYCSRSRGHWHHPWAVAEPGKGHRFPLGALGSHGLNLETGSSLSGK
jgi:hypothetical protein